MTYNSSTTQIFIITKTRRPNIPNITPSKRTTLERRTRELHETRHATTPQKLSHARSVREQPRGSRRGPSAARTARAAAREAWAPRRSPRSAGPRSAGRARRPERRTSSSTAPPAPQPEVGSDRAATEAAPRSGWRTLPANHLASCARQTAQVRVCGKCAGGREAPLRAREGCGGAVGDG